MFIVSEQIYDLYEKIASGELKEENMQYHNEIAKALKEDYDFKDDVKEKSKKMSKKEKERLIATLEKQMREAARKLDFEEAATLRDAILELKAED